MKRREKEVEGWRGAHWEYMLDRGSHQELVLITVEKQNENILLHFHFFFCK